MRIQELAFLATIAASCAMAQPVVQAVVNGASYSTNLAPGTWSVIYGAALAPADGSSAGVSVTVAGVNAPLIFVSLGQINALIPIDTATLNLGQQTALPLVVTTPAGSSAPFMVKVSRVAPAIFTVNGGGTGPALAWDANFNPLSTVGSGTIIMYATGLGPATPPGVDDWVTVFIGEQSAYVDFAGPAPGLPGIYQLNVTANGPVSNGVYLVEDGVRSNTATLPVPVGVNVANVTGSIVALYPTSAAEPVTFSALLTAGAFQVSFDILPNAAPFTVTASAGEANATININPAQNTWKATVTVPTPTAAHYDFSNSGFPVIDFLTGRPFPGNIIPFTRVDPTALSALSLLLLPMSTSSPAAGANSTFISSGVLPAGSHFAIGNGTLTQLSNFGGFTQIPQQFGSSLTATFQLFVDGLLVASKDIQYQVD